MPEKIRDDYIVPMLDRGLSILEYIYDKKRPAGVREIATALDIPKATVYRLLYTLKKHGYVTQDESDQYRLGLTYITYSSQLKNQWDFLSAVRPILKKAVEEIGETINISILYNDTAIILDSLQGEEFFISRNLIPITPLYCSAMGKIFLANYTDSELKNYIRKTNFKPRTVSTITTGGTLMKELDSIKEKGIAYDREEYEYGLTCIGRGIYKNGELLSAISISGPTSRLKHKGFEKLESQLSACGDEIENLIERVDISLF